MKMTSGTDTPRNDGSGSALEALERLALGDRRDVIEHALDAARELLGMDIAYFSELTRGEQVIRQVTGDRGAFPVEPGASVPLEQTYCTRMLAGRLPNAVPDAQHDPRVADLAATAELGIGSYVGVPLQLADGRVYGTMCCASATANERLDPRDVRFMHVLARLIADELEREEQRLPAPREVPAPPSDVARAASEAVEEIPGAVLKLDLWFAAAPRAAPAARAALEVLGEQVDGGCLQAARLLVTELVTNSVRHAGLESDSAVGLALRLTEERLTVAISDPGPGFTPEIVEPGLDQEGGRGLFIVDQLAHRWGVGDSPLTPPRGRKSEAGTVVWFELEPAPGAES